MLVEGGVGEVWQLDRLRVPEARAAAGRRVRRATHNQLLVRQRARRAAIVHRPRISVVRVERVIFEGEAVVSPERVVPVLDYPSVAVADEGPELRRRVPLLGQDAGAACDVEGVVSADHRLVQGRHAGDVLHTGSHLHEAVTTVMRGKHRANLTILDGRVVTCLRPAALYPGDRLKQHRRNIASGELAGAGAAAARLERG